RRLERRRLPARRVLFRLSPADSPRVGAAVWDIGGSLGCGLLIASLSSGCVLWLPVVVSERTAWRREPCSDVTMKPPSGLRRHRRPVRRTSRSFRRGTPVAGRREAGGLCHLWHRPKIQRRSPTGAPA